MRTILCIFFLPACLLGGVFEDQVVPILERSCLKCHGGEKTKGKVDFSGILTELDAGDHLDLWETVVEVVELGEMPPEDENPLSSDEKKGIRGWHEEFLKLPVETAIPVFRPRRLSANEYRNTLRSLFGFDLEVGIARAEQTESGDKSLILKILPPDPRGKAVSSMIPIPPPCHLRFLRTTPTWLEFPWIGFFPFRERTLLPA